jgi:3-(methylthio)propanoyl-CoA dehydrogenase
MANFYEDNADLRWYVERGIDWEPVARLTEYDWKAEDGHRDLAEAVGFYRDVLGLIGEVAGDRLAPRWAELERAHPRFEGGRVEDAPVVRELMATLDAAGLPGLCLPRELGGMNAPLLVWHAVTELLARADTSLAAHAGFHGGMALAALMYSVMEGSTAFQAEPPRITATRFQACIDDILQNQAWGSMDITEPDAGSDMGALRTRATLGDDGVWRLTGQKVFITSGHGRWHFVIARTEDAVGDGPMAGLAGLSMFLVPAWEEDEAGGRRWLLSLDGVEDKLGHTASATVSLSFEDTPGQLIGQRGEGFKYMLLLMNNARVAVGFESLGVAEAAFRTARSYAAVRRSMGKTIDQHELVADLLDEMETDILGIRALGMAAAWEEELNQKLRLALRHFPVPADERPALERRHQRHQRQSRRLTPLLKWLASERCVRIARQSIQVHGGSGYIRETGVERLLRDAMVFPIYEGTSQIQALMVMKDHLVAAVKDPGRFLKRAARHRWLAVSARDPDEKRVAALAVQADQAQQFLLTRLAATKLRDLPLGRPNAWSEVLRDWDPKKDFALAMLHAERLTGLLANAAVAEVLWAQVQKDPARRPVLSRWLERAEPDSRSLLDRVETTGARLLQQLRPADAGAEAAK